MSRLAALAVILAAALWGIDGIVLRPALYSLPVSLVVLIESSLVAMLLTPFFIRRSYAIRLLKYKDWIAFLGVAIFGGAIGTMAITKALFYVNYVNLSIVILIQKLQPLFAILFATILLKEKLSAHFFIWAGLSIVGAYLITFGSRLPIIDSGDKTFEASMYALLAAISFAASTVFSKRALRNVDFELGTYLRFLISTFVMIIVVLVFNKLPAVSTISTQQIFIFLLIAFTTGGAAIFLYYYGLKRIKASVATICELAFPLTAIILEYFIRDNILDIAQWCGVVLLIFGIYKVTSFNRSL